MAPGLTIRITCLLAFAVGFLLLAGEPARTQSDPAAEDMPSVTIETQAELEKRVQTYVRRITASPRFQRESLARWSKALCFEVAGLPKKDAEFMVWRLTQIAHAVGAQVQARECSRRKANFYVVFTPDPAKTLKYLKWHPKLLFDRDANIGQINKFLADSTPLPVRVWHNGEEIGRNGMPVRTNIYCAGYDSGFMPTNCEAGDSRVTLSAFEGLTEAVIVFDANRISGLSIGQLSDYTAMAGLVDLDINADLAEAPTILRLFTQTEGSRPQGLSEWDQAFLTATYHTDPKGVDQRGAIARVVARDLSR
jgi:hypothetical protein